MLLSARMSGCFGVERGDDGVEVSEHLSVHFGEAVLAAGRSTGLPGMHERVMLLAGQLNIESTPGGGAHLLAELPLDGHPGRSP